jgi:hypothetical protein
MSKLSFNEKAFFDNIPFMTDETRSVIPKSAPCMIARMSFKMIESAVEKGFDITSTCREGCFVHRTAMRWCRGNTQFLQTFLNYHSVNFRTSTEGYEPPFDGKKCLDALVFLTTITEKLIVFRLEDYLYPDDVEDERKLIIYLPVLMKKMHLFPELIGFCDLFGFFSGSEDRIASVLYKSLCDDCDLLRRSMRPPTGAKQITYWCYRSEKQRKEEDDRYENVRENTEKACWTLENMINRRISLFQFLLPVLLND